MINFQMADRAWKKVGMLLKKTGSISKRRERLERIQDGQSKRGTNGGIAKQRLSETWCPPGLWRWSSASFVVDRRINRKRLLGSCLLIASQLFDARQDYHQLRRENFPSFQIYLPRGLEVTTHP